MSSALRAQFARRAILLLAGLSFGWADTPSLQAQAYCYECGEGDFTESHGCMECYHPVVLGHVSCIPYCNRTCSVGGPCQAVLRDLQVSPDGSIWHPNGKTNGGDLRGGSLMLRFASVLGIRSQSTETGYSRNCVNAIVARE